MFVRILAAEDTRDWTPELAALLANRSANLRRRAALAAGRIGDERAVAPLVARLRSDAEESVRAIAAFALGEIESAAAGDALIEVLRTSRSAAVRTRAIEALGKIAAALPQTNEKSRARFGDEILRSLDTPPAAPNQTLNTDFILSALTAVLRARPANAGAIVRHYVTAADANTRATALNTLARLRVKDANEIVRPLLNDADPIVRANAARVLGAGEDRAGVEQLVTLIETDADERVRVSSIRALAGIKDERAAQPLRERFAVLLAAYRDEMRDATAAIVTRPNETNELLEIATALGTIFAGKADQTTLDLLRSLREVERAGAPEIEIALSRVAPAAYLRDDFVQGVADAPAGKPWQTVASVAEGLGEIARATNPRGGGAGGNSDVVLRADALIRTRQMLDSANLHPSARPAVLRALAVFKQPDATRIFAAEMSNADVHVRATAAELLGEIVAADAVTPATREEVIIALTTALPGTLADTEPDAALAILSALAPLLPAPAVTAALESASAAPNGLIRRRAATLLRAHTNVKGDDAHRARVGAFKSQFDTDDYARAVARAGKRVYANVTTDKGAFTIELLPDAAPLTVDNFITLARKNFFDNVTFHRVVPNFVVQTGDPRGDGNGGPGYQIRCEINTVPYERGAIGMALSGKDTGGSQWFVTHSPQPHLDGGYTVFARVVEGMDVIDRITRGDRIREVRVTETPKPARRTHARRGSR